MRVLMSRPRLGVPFAVLAPFVLMGCEAALQGQPRATLDDSRPSLNTLVIGGTLSQANVNAALVNQTDGKRNAIVLARVAELDTLYNEYESTLLFEARQSGFLLSFTGALAGLAGSQASAAASQNYSLLSGGINAAQSSYEKEVLAEQTMNALISQMRAERARVLGEIYDKLRAPVSRYPVQAAISDLERYRQAGTLATGLVAMNQASVQRAEIETAAAAKKVDRFVTGVERRAPGRDFQASVPTRTFQDRVRILSERIKNGQVSPEKVAAFMNNPPLSDPEFKQFFVDYAEVIKAVTTQDTVRAEDLSPDFLAGIGGFMATATDEASLIEAEAALSN